LRSSGRTRLVVRAGGPAGGLGGHGGGRGEPVCVFPADLRAADTRCICCTLRHRLGTQLVAVAHQHGSF
jgi:hypothetical protein